MNEDSKNNSTDKTVSISIVNKRKRTNKSNDNVEKDTELNSPPIELENKRSTFKDEIKQEKVDSKKRNKRKKNIKKQKSIEIRRFLLIGGFIFIILFAIFFTKFISISPSPPSVTSTTLPTTNTISLILDGKWNEELVTFNTQESTIDNLDSLSVRIQRLDLLERLDYALSSLKELEEKERGEKVQNTIFPIFHDKNTPVTILDENLSVKSRTNVEAYFTNLASNIVNYRFVKPIDCSVKTIEGERGKISLYLDDITMVEIQ